MLDRGDDLAVLIHTLRECYAVLTRSASSNGYDVEPAHARSRIYALTAASRMRLLDDPPHAYDLWLELCERENVKGVLCHDAYFAACALTLDVRVYALDRDFTRFGVRPV